MAARLSLDLIEFPRRKAQLGSLLLLIGGVEKGQRAISGLRLGSLSRRKTSAAPRCGPKVPLGAQDQPRIQIVGIHLEVHFRGDRRRVAKSPSWPDQSTGRQGQ